MLVMNQALMTLKLCLKVNSQSKNEKYVNGSVGARVRLMVRGGCLSVKEWKYADHLSEYETKETEMHVLSRITRYD